MTQLPTSSRLKPLLELTARRTARRFVLLGSVRVGVLDQVDGIGQGDQGLGVDTVTTYGGRRD